jgi:site-specific DNA-methyltransferase (adenine-specific)
MIQITNEDNMELMARYEDNHFDLAIVDPPYGIGIANSEQIGTSKKHKIKDWDNYTPKLSFFNELKRVSKKQIVWGVNYFDGMSLNGGRIIWNKLGKDIGRRKVAPTFSECEIAYYSGANNVKMYSYTYIGNVQGNDYQILWSNTNRIHPTQKPVKLYEWLLMNYAKDGDKILDTHLGSGSIAIACHNLGFDLTACELDKDYYEAAIKRLKQHQAQLTMF